MVDVLSSPAAVLTSMTISDKDTTPSDRAGTTLRRTHVVAQTHNRGKLDLVALRAQKLTGPVHDIGALVQDQNRRSTVTDHRQWLVRCIEHKRLSHDRPYRAHPRRFGEFSVGSASFGRGTESMHDDAGAKRLTAGCLSTTTLHDEEKLPIVQ